MLTSFTRTIFFYFVLLVVIRLLGKRQIGQMEPSEFVVTMLVANLASIPMEDPKLPLHSGLVPMGAVLLAELLLTRFSLRSVKFRRLLCGKPVILIENGRIIQKNLRRTHITLDELTGQLRLKDVLDLRTVQYAILETNGNLSVFLYPKDSPATAKDAGIHPKKQHLPVTVVGLTRFSVPRPMRWVETALSPRNTFTVSPIRNSPSVTRTVKSVPSMAVMTPLPVCLPSE